MRKLFKTGVLIVYRTVNVKIYTDFDYINTVQNWQMELLRCKRLSCMPRCMRCVRWVEVLKLWNRLVSVTYDRVHKRHFVPTETSVLIIGVRK